MAELKRKEQHDYLTISELNRLFNMSLERTFPEVRFEGEISQISRAGSGHIYFTVKDADSQLSAVMWRGIASSLDFAPEPGLAVLCHGRPNVYSVTGKLQVVVHRMVPAGEGALQKKFLELKAKLEKEGLFSSDRKRDLPLLPKAVGIVTSGTGAVIHDIQVKVRERMPSMKLFLVDVRVQGEGSVDEISEGIKLLDESGLVDVIIVARGGGSLQDLWSFNEEKVVRAIFASRTPVVSGVGHEVDVTLSDLVADVRAPTPTAAAELVVPSRNDLLEAISDFEKRLNAYERWLEPKVQALDELSIRLENRIRGVVEEARLKLTASEAHLKLLHPESIISLYQQKLGALRERLLSGGLHSITLFRKALDGREADLRAAFPVQKLHLLNEKLRQVKTKLSESILRKLKDSATHISNLGTRLNNVNPRQVLSRGYSVIESRRGIVTSSRDVDLSDDIHITLFEGKLSASVTGKD